MVFSISTFMLIQYTESLTRNHVFFAIWLLCNYSSIWLCKIKVIIICLPFMTVSSVITSLCLIGQYLCILCSTLCSACGQPCIMYNLKLLQVCILLVGACMSPMDVYIGITTTVLMTCTVTFIPAIL